MFIMDYELEVFEVYDDNTEQNASKKHLKHTRKKCKQKKLTTSCSNNIRLENENEINRSKTSVVSSSEHNRPLSITESILNVFSKIVVWRDQKGIKPQYQINWIHHIHQKIFEKDIYHVVIIQY